MCFHITSLFRIYYFYMIFYSCNVPRILLQYFVNTKFISRNDLSVALILNIFYHSHFSFISLHFCTALRQSGRECHTRFGKIYTQTGLKKNFLLYKVDFTHTRHHQEFNPLKCFPFYI